MVLALTLVLLLALLVIHVPIAFALGIVSALYMWLSQVDLIIMAQQIANGPDSWILLSMPLFVMAGLLMNTTGIARRLIDFANALVGHFRGGLGMVNVLTSMIFGGISGSSVADAAALGTILIPAMDREGYPRGFAAALTSSSASIGIIIPPSISMIIYGAVASTSLGTLFVAGIIPGIMVGVSQMIIVYFLSRRYKWGMTTPFSLPTLIRTAIGASLGLLMPVIIIGGILLGIFTPTEAGAVGVVYGIIVSLFFYKSLSFRKLYRVLVDSAVLTSVVMIVIATSYTLSWVLSHEQVPQRIANVFLSLSGNQAVVLFSISLVLILAGCILHGDPLILILVPLVLPAVARFGIDLTHFGMIVIFCVAIGQQTPPVGSTLFVVSAISGQDILTVTRSNIPFILLFIVLLAILVFLPEVALFLPRLIYPQV